MKQISLELGLKTWFTQKKIKNKLKFVNLTLAPIEKDLINFKLLKESEKKYLNEYHKKVYLILGSYLNKNERIWLRSFFN